MTIRKNDLKGGSYGHLLYWLAFIFYVLFLFSPILLKFILNPYEETIYTFLRPLLIIVSFVSLCFVAKHRILSICLLIIFACTTICEWVMLCNYAYYMDIDTFMAFATTNWEEGSHFALNNLHALWYIIPLLIVFINSVRALSLRSITSYSNKINNVRCRYEYIRSRSFTY